jgi:excisionase family DNA binding protein
MTRLMTIAEVQRQLAVSRATVYRLRDRGALRLVNIGRAARVPSEDVESYLSTLIATSNEL